LVEDADAVRIEEQAIEGALQALYAEPGEALSVLYDAFGRRERLVRAVQMLLGEGGRLEARLGAYARGEVTIDDWLAETEPAPEAVHAWLDEVARPLIDEIHRLAAPGGGAFATGVLAPLVARLRALPADPLHRNALYRDVVEALCGANGPRSLVHHSVIGRKGDWPSALYTVHKEGLAALQARLPDVVARREPARRLPGPADRDLLEALGHLARLVLDALARKRALLDAERRVDFGELQRRAVVAVTGDTGLRERLWARHRYLMVDEFQDTDADQWALVRALGRPSGDPADRIFLVGDTKQAIYGFRGGDVEVFDAATRAIGSEPVRLGENFRSRDVLIRWFNAAFETVLGGSGGAGVTYEPLRAGRGAPGGSVLLVPHEEGGGAAGVAEAEADAVARWIGGQMLAARGAYENADWLDREAHPEPPVAILLQRRTWQPLFERALRVHGVPFVVARGVGFWSRPEILDLVNALHALATGDPISVLGALRSPLFAVPDT